MLSRKSCCDIHDLLSFENCSRKPLRPSNFCLQLRHHFLTMRVCAKIVFINAEFPQLFTGIHTVRSLSWHRVYTPTAECFVTLLTRVLVFSLARFTWCTWSRSLLDSSLHIFRIRCNAILICRFCSLAGRASSSNEEEKLPIVTGHSFVVFVVQVVASLLLVSTFMQRL